MNFLPSTKEEWRQTGWDAPDIILITGDAYVDHPSFGAAIISRLLEKEGYRVAILDQPDWNSAQAFQIFGAPKLGFFITGGNIDSMVNHYTAAKKRRSQDLYSPGGKSGLRPDRAAIVYAQKIRQIYKNMPIVLGGIEASLRRFAHYDYWDDKIRQSILIDSGADLLIYGMGENSVIAVAGKLREGIPIAQVTGIRGTLYRTKSISHLHQPVMLPSFQTIVNSKEQFCESFMLQYQNTEAATAHTLVEPYGHFYVVQNPPSFPLEKEKLDAVYHLPYMKNYHPKYKHLGGIPAIKEVKFSLVSNRGCFGGCNFCALSFHQGRVVQSRSHDSLVKEAAAMVEDPEFKGYIHDVGGPTANFREPACAKQNKEGACTHRKCLFPKPCRQLRVSHQDYMALLKKLKDIKGIKRVFIRSGIRFDYLIYDTDKTFLTRLCQDHVSGQLKVAPEHVSPSVLEKMGKPPNTVYEQFSRQYQRVNQKLGLKQYLVPYFMSSHPGSTLADAVMLAEYLRDINFTPEQVQDFYPTPGTASTCMYYTGLDPFTMAPVYIPKSPEEKAMQRALIQFRLPQNRQLVIKALKKAGRTDLIGHQKQCLVKTGGAAQGKTAKRQPPAKSKARPDKKKKTIRNIHKKKG